MFLDFSLKNENNCQIEDVFKKNDKLPFSLIYKSMVPINLCVSRVKSSKKYSLYTLNYYPILKSIVRNSDTSFVCS